MPYFIMSFLSRKSDLTPEQFKSYYIGSHMPLVRQLVGSHFPVRCIQRYIQRGEGTDEGDNTERNSWTPATVLHGDQSDFDFDVVVTMEFKDAAAFRAHRDFVNQGDVLTKLIEDEKRFIDRDETRTVVLGDIIETTAQSTRTIPDSIFLDC
ncbi:EthD domain-containing protein [Xylaria scruposa]|nr:EthD domain-containing protein [Xylaria scruposa]